MRTKTITHFKRNLFRVIFMLSFVGIPAMLSAASVSLLVSHDGDWNNPTNWDVGAVPTTADIVYIPKTITNKTITIKSGTAAVCNQIYITQTNLVIESGGSLTINHSTLGVNQYYYPIKLASGTLVNNGTLSLTGNTTAANFTTQINYYLVDLENDATTLNNASFENGSTGILNMDISGFKGATVNTTYTPTLFYFNQAASTGATPTVKLNGTVNVSMKSYAVAGASAIGYQSRIFHMGNTVNSKIDGTMTLGSTGAPLVDVLALTNVSAGTITFPSTANITFNLECSGTTGHLGQGVTYTGTINNSGILTFNAPSEKGGVSQMFFGLKGLTNSGTFNIIGKLLNRGLMMASSGTSSVPTFINNSGNLNITNTTGGDFAGIGAYTGTYNKSTYPNSGTATKGVFQITNTGTINIYSATHTLTVPRPTLSFMIGNNHSDSWVKNSGTINVNDPIASSVTWALKGDGTSGYGASNYYSAVPTTTAKWYNSGIVNFDVAANTNPATQVCNTVADGTTSNVNVNFAAVTFKNYDLAATTGGTVKGRGTFVAGSFDNTTLGTLSPGNGVTTINYGGGNTTSTTQVGTANIGQFDIQGAAVALNGNAMLDAINSTTAGTTYDQIINSTASGTLNVNAVKVNLSASGALAGTYPLFKATGTSGALAGASSFATSPTLPISGDWSTVFSTPAVNFTRTFNAFSTTYGTASASQSTLIYVASGLTQSLVVNAPIGFEVSSDGTTFGATATYTQSSGSTSGDLYVRLKNNASVGIYNSQNVSLTSNLPTTNISTSASGNVVAAKTLTLNNAATTFKASDYTIADLANSDLVVSSGEFSADLVTNAVQSVSVAPGAKLTLGSNTLTTTNGITLESDATGTATLIDSYTEPTINATVKQYLSSARNWYFTPAVSGSAVPASSTYFGYDESGSNEDFSVSGASAFWKPYYTNDPLTAGKGYIVQPGSATTLSFTNTTVSGDVSPVLTYNSSKGKGYNLVGNPYPSYLSWSAVYDYDFANGATANMPTGTIWYRTVNYNEKSAWEANHAYSVNDIVYNGTRFYKVTTGGTSAASGGPTGTGTGIDDNGVIWNYEGSVYVFATVSATGVATPSTVNNLIPPMQAFWVKTGAVGGTLHFKNSMRSHNTTGGTNALKAPKNTASDLQLLRLNVTNGASADEAVIYASKDANNLFDTNDAPKYFNSAGSIQPEIYTQVGNEKLVINAMNEIASGTEIPLGFSTEKGSDFTISATEFSNFGSGMQIILKDKQKNTEFNLTSGLAYEFSSDVVNDANRFSIIFRTSGVATGIDNSAKLNTQVFINAANHITIIAPEKASYSIYNAMGQLIENGLVTLKHETRNTKITSGVYFVALSVNGQSEIQKVIIR